MDLLLRFKDRPRYKLRRLTLALAGLCHPFDAPGKKSGAKEAGSGAKDRFVRFSQAVTGARALMKKAGYGRADLLCRLETAGACLETAFLDMQLHDIKPDAEALEALFFIGQALRSQADFIARPARKAALAEAATNIAAASKGLSRALRAAKTDDREFIANLKFSRIYSGLEKTVFAVDDYAELLARTL